MTPVTSFLCGVTSHFLAKKSFVTVVTFQPHLQCVGRFKHSKVANVQTSEVAADLAPVNVFNEILFADRSSKDEEPGMNT
jgi:hypothetical protein